MASAVKHTRHRRRNKRTSPVFTAVVMFIILSVVCTGMSVMPEKDKLPSSDSTISDSFSDDMNSPDLGSDQEPDKTPESTPEPEPKPEPEPEPEDTGISVTVIDAGIECSVSLEGGTVTDVLDLLGIEYDSDDEVFPAPNVTLENGMSITVDHISTETIPTYYVLEYDTEYIANSSMYEGESRTVSEGVNGERVITYEKVMKNGLTVSMEPVSDTVTREKVDAVVEYGTRPVLSVYTLSGELILYEKRIESIVTAYSTEGRVNKITHCGEVACREICAADWDVIPCWSKIYVRAMDNSWERFVTVGDTGKSITDNDIDLFFDTQLECVNFGIQNAYTYIIEWGRGYDG